MSNSLPNKRGKVTCLQKNFARQGEKVGYSDDRHPPTPILTASHDPQSQLMMFLAEKELLLVVDNLDHLLQNVAIVADLLLAAPGLKILATSREVLNLEDEWLYPVAALPVLDDSIRKSTRKVEEPSRLEEYDVAPRHAASVSFVTTSGNRSQTTHAAHLCS